MPNALRVLAINPFHGGSHRAFIEAVTARSRYHWDVIAGKPIHWKWRMRSAPLALAKSVKHYLSTHGVPDRLFCTDMLDVPGWLGMMRRTGIDGVPLVLYMHENQWTYPVVGSSSDHVVDHHYGYTNLLSVIAADACVFNSEFHRADFFAASKRFVQRMPDGKSDHDWEAIEEKTSVIAPGFVPPDFPADGHQRRILEEDCRQLAPNTDEVSRLRVGWVSRWETDKRPDRLLEFCDRLEQSGVLFELILLGTRPRHPDDSLRQLHQRHGGRILQDGFAVSKQVYWKWLQRMDIVVSFADHEFFGIAICEAIEAGAIPLVPNRLSYTETTLPDCRFESMDEAIELARKFSEADVRDSVRPACHSLISTFTITQTVEQLDELLTNV